MLDLLSEMLLALLLHVRQATDITVSAPVTVAAVIVLLGCVAVSCALLTDGRPWPTLGVFAAAGILAGICAACFSDPSITGLQAGALLGPAAGGLCSGHGRRFLLRLAGRGAWIIAAVCAVALGADVPAVASVSLLAWTGGWAARHLTSARQEVAHGTL